jgi:hypothetical protein
MTQVLSDSELTDVILSARKKWNDEADYMNQWSDMDEVEQCEVSGRAVEAAILAQLVSRQQPVAWRWSESQGKRWCAWTTDWTDYDQAKSMGCMIEFAHTE